MPTLCLGVLFNNLAACRSYFMHCVLNITINNTEKFKATQDGSVNLFLCKIFPLKFEAYISHILEHESRAYLSNNKWKQKKKIKNLFFSFMWNFKTISLRNHMNMFFCLFCQLHHFMSWFHFRLKSFTPFPS